MPSLYDDDGFLTGGTAEILPDADTEGGKTATDRKVARTAALPRTPHLLRALRSREVMGGTGSRGMPRLASRYVPSGGMCSVRNLGSKVYSGQFSPSGRYLVVAAQDEKIYVLNGTTLKSVKTVDARGVQWTITSTDVTPDERFLLYTSINETMHLCNLEDGAGELHEPLSLEDEALPAPLGTWCAKFSAGGQEVVAGCGNRRNGVGELVVYDIERKCVAQRVAAHTDDINAVCFADAAFSPHLLVSGSDDTMVKVWDRRILPATYDPSTPVLTQAAGYLPGHHAGVTSLEARGDGVYVLSNSKDQTAKLWDIRMMTSHAEHDAMPGHARYPVTWDYRWEHYPYWGTKWRHPGDRSAMTYRGHRVGQTLIRAHFSPWALTGGKYVVSGSSDAKVLVWEASTGDIVSRFSGARAVIRDVSWHPTMPLLATSSWDGGLRLFGPNLSLSKQQDGEPAADIRKVDAVFEGAASDEADEVAAMFGGTEDEDEDEDGDWGDGQEDSSEESSSDGEEDDGDADGDAEEEDGSAGAAASPGPAAGTEGPPANAAGGAGDGGSDGGSDDDDSAGGRRRARPPSDSDQPSAQRAKRGDDA